MKALKGLGTWYMSKKYRKRLENDKFSIICSNCLEGDFALLR